MIAPDLAYQIAETIRRDALTRTEDHHTRYRIAGIEQDTILTLAPGPSTIPALEQIELPSDRSDLIMWETANRAWLQTMTPALVKKWAIALIRHISAEDRDRKHQQERQRTRDRRRTATPTHRRENARPLDQRETGHSLCAGGNGRGSAHPARTQVHPADPLPESSAERRQTRPPDRSCSMSAATLLQAA